MTMRTAQKYNEILDVVVAQSADDTAAWIAQLKAIRNAQREKIDALVDALKDLMQITHDEWVGTGKSAPAGFTKAFEAARYAIYLAKGDGKGVGRG